MKMDPCVPSIQMTKDRTIAIVARRMVTTLVFFANSRQKNIANYRRRLHHLGFAPTKERVSSKSKATQSSGAVTAVWNMKDRYVFWILSKAKICFFLFCRLHQRIVSDLRVFVVFFVGVVTLIYLSFFPTCIALRVHYRCRAK